MKSLSCWITENNVQRPTFNVRYGIHYGTGRTRKRDLNMKIQRRKIMARGSKNKYTGKQKRKAEKIARGYKKRGVSKKEASRRAWATVNKESGGGKKSGSGRGKKENRSASRKGGRKGGHKKKRK